MQRFTLAVVLVLVPLGGGAATAEAPETPAPKPTPYETLLSIETAAKPGLFTIHEADEHTLLEIPKEMLGREMFWYAEAVAVPTEFNSLLGENIGSAVVRWDRRGNKVYLRDMTERSRKRVRFSHDPMAKDESPSSHDKLAPVERAVASAALPPIMLAFPVIAEGPGGSVVVDVTDSLESDIREFSVRLALSGEVAIGEPDPARSYIEATKSFPKNISLRVLITFRGLPISVDPEAAAMSPRHAFSVVVGHTIALLPEPPMKARLADPRVGYFATGYDDYDAAGRADIVTRSLILRRRLEKKNPAAALSDPVEPIVFYIGRDVPDKWRPYVKKGVEDWRPAFKAAGFSNAVVAKDAPSMAEDNDWAPEDARWSIVRWIAQPIANAMGANIHDPRSGEILSAHVLVWADILDFAQQVYFARGSAVDERARKLPLPDDLLGELLRSIVSHEIGHSLGLRHNMKASQAYSVAQLRDPAFANPHGPVASIMSYGRANYVAQPGDGVTQLLPRIGPYDRFAIEWGYRPIPEAATPAEEGPTLDQWAARQIGNPWLAFGGEDEAAIFDPMVLTENVGLERIEATRLGLANLERALDFIVPATTHSGGSFDWLEETYETLLATRARWIRSVAKQVGGIVEHRTLVGRGGAQFVPVAPDKQRQAARFVLDEGLAVPEAYLRPSLLALFAEAGATRPVERHQEAILNSLLSGRVYATLHQQAVLAPDGAYTIAAFLDDVTKSVWDELTVEAALIPPLRRAIQRHYLDRLEAQLFEPPSAAVGEALEERGVPLKAIEILLSNGRKTDFPASAVVALAKLRAKISAALDSTHDNATRTHLRQSRDRIDVIVDGDE